MSALLIENLNKTYANGRKALIDINLSIDAGDFYAILGANGAGKSTLIGIITSLVNKTSGCVSVFGNDLDRQVDLVISDMAPRMSGVVSRDQALALELAEAAVKVAGCLLTHHGTLLVKVFEGETTTAFRHQVQERFERHVSRKPAASRNESRERYVIATNPLTGPPSGLEKQ